MPFGYYAIVILLVTQRDGMAFTLSTVKASALSLALGFILVFFLINSPPSFPQNPRRSLLADTPKTLTSCSAKSHQSNGLFNYMYFHFCLVNENSSLSIPFLSLFLLLYFYILIKTAQDHFSVVTTKLSLHLSLSPSMGAVTLLALGNGAPDVFASVAAVRKGHYRTGFGAILSAGTFVSAFVVGFVAIYAAPFSVDPAPFVRDVLFYLIAALFLFYVYLSAEISLWQAIGFIVFYLFFVGLVFYMDLKMDGRKRRGGTELGFNGDTEGKRLPISDNFDVKATHTSKENGCSSGLRRALKSVC